MPSETLRPPGTAAEEEKTMTKLEYLLSYQQADIKKQKLEDSVKSTESRQKMMRLHKSLKEHQATIQKLTEETESMQLSLMRLISQQDKLKHDLELNVSEMETLSRDEECTAEEMTEFRKDVDKLNRELNKMDKDVKALSEQLEKAVEAFQRTRSLAGRAKKEYDQVKAVCEVEKNDAAAAVNAAAKEMACVERQVDPAFLAKYKRARLHHKEPVVPVVHDKCSGCNMSLPMAVIKKLNGQDSIVECENCGRILYSK